MGRKKSKRDGTGGTRKKDATLKTGPSMKATSGGLENAPPDNTNTAATHLDTNAKTHPTLSHSPPQISHEARVEPSTKSVPPINAKENLNRASEHLASNKRRRNRQDDGDYQSPEKRPKLSGKTGTDHEPNIALPTHGSKHITNAQPVNDRKTHEAQERPLPVEVQHLTQKFVFNSMSIISSSKIESRVRNLLEKTERFRFGKLETKPGAVVLSAKANVAGKMGSIVEIAKQKIVEEKGKWWQYTKLHGQLLELKPKRTRPAGDGQIFAERDEGRERGSDTEPMVTQEAGNASTKEPESEEDEEIEESFETMDCAETPNRGLTSETSRGEQKVHSTPVMTIFFARVPIPGLKELYG